MNEGEYPMILATLRMIIPSDKQLETLSVLRWIADQDRCLPGCLSFRIYHDDEEEDFLMIEELWRSQEELERRLQSDNYRHMLLLAETATQPPEIKFQTITESAGLEVIERARGVSYIKGNDVYGKNFDKESI
jgi:quinol monooxygenase YgiN